MRRGIDFGDIKDLINFDRLAAGNDMGHDCRICRRTKPNEQFSRKGHRTHVCKDCARTPKQHRDAIEQEEEIFNYLQAVAHLGEEYGPTEETGWHRVTPESLS